MKNIRKSISLLICTVAARLPPNPNIPFDFRVPNLEAKRETFVFFSREKYFGKVKRAGTEAARVDRRKFFCSRFVIRNVSCLQKKELLYGEDSLEGRDEAMNSQFHVIFKSNIFASLRTHSLWLLKVVVVLVVLKAARFEKGKT